MLKSRILLLGGALAAVLVLPTAASAAGTKLTATLTGATGGDAKGSGKFTADVDPDSGDFCYTLVAKGSDKPTAAHVHTGAAGADGPPVVPLQITGEGVDSCVAVEPETLKAIIAAPEGYYVNVHSAAFPKGAVRGQLGKGS